MKKLKQKIFLFIVCIICISIQFVSAQTIDCFVNSNGIVVSKKEYQFISDFYGKDYFETMSLELN